MNKQFVHSFVPSDKVPNNEVVESEARQEIEAKVDAGGGCTETWEALSQIRESKEENSRRNFLKNLGISIGALTMGTGTAVAHDSDEEKPEIEREEIRGRERGQLISEAVQSNQVRYVADELGQLPDVDSVYKYTIDGSNGYGIQFGNHKESTYIIQYYKSKDLYYTEVKAFGAKKVGEGVMTVDGSKNELVDIATPRVKDQIKETKKRR